MTPSRQCRATSRRTGEQCKRPAIIGGTVCYWHGGGAPHVRAAAARRVAEEQALRFLDLQDGVPVDDPVGALQELGGKAVALVDMLRGQVAILESVSTEPNNRWGQQIHPAIQGYVAAIRECERILSSLARLNLSERAVRLDEQRAAIVVAVIEAVLSRHGVDPQAIDVRAHVAEQLELAAG